MERAPERLFRGKLPSHETLRLTRLSLFSSDAIVESSSRLAELFKSEERTSEPSELSAIVTKKIAKLLISGDSHMPRYWELC